MEINTNILLGFLFIGILVLLFSKITVSVGSEGNNDTPKYTRPIISIGGAPNHPTSGPPSRKLTVTEAQGLPAKNDYMSNSLRKQLNSMEDRYYYNNCRWEPNF